MTTDAIEEIGRWVGCDATSRLEQCTCQRAEAVVAAMYEDAKRVEGRELARALDKLDARDELSDDRRAILEGMADAIVEQLLATPMANTGDAGDRATLDAAVRLLDLEVAVDGADVHGQDSDRPEVVSDDD